MHEDKGDTAMSSALVWAERLTKQYRSSWAVRDLDLAVGEGERAVFLGPPGSGKSTLFRLLTGMVRPTAGRARVMGLDPARHGHLLRARIGYVPGVPRLPGHMTGTEFIDYCLSIRRLPSRAAGHLVDRLGPVMDLPIRRCPEGTGRKLAIIQALAAPVSVLFLDEPAEGLDHRARQEFRSLLQEARAAGTTVLMSSRSPDAMGLVPDRVFIFDRGRVVASGDSNVLDDRRFRIVTVLFEPGSRIPLPEELLGPDIVEMESLSRYCVRFSEGEGSGGLEGYRISVRGDWQDFLSRLSAHPVHDLRVEVPALEAMFPDIFAGPDDDLTFMGCEVEEDHADHG